VLVLENARYLTVTLIERSSAVRFGPCFDAGSQQIEHEHDDEHDSLTSESGFNDRSDAATDFARQFLLNYSDATANVDGKPVTSAGPWQVYAGAAAARLIGAIKVIPGT
jgi:hypothetical protein